MSKPKKLRNLIHPSSSQFSVKTLQQQIEAVGDMAAIMTKKYIKDFQKPVELLQPLLDYINDVKKVVAVKQEPEH